MAGLPTSGVSCSAAATQTAVLLLREVWLRLQDPGAIAVLTTIAVALTIGLKTAGYGHLLLQLCLHSDMLLDYDQFFLPQFELLTT